MPEPIERIDADLVGRRLRGIREQLPAGTRILCATKYLRAVALPELARAGVELVGENRLGDLEAKQAEHRDLFEWHFIGQLQSRKAVAVAERVSLIHSLSTDSALERLRTAGATTPALIQVNVAGDPGKAGVEPGELGAFIERCPVPVRGLTTMPPQAADPEQSRPHFARLAELAAEHGLDQLSMGTSQDWRVAAEEGATIVRVGGAILR